MSWVRCVVLAECRDVISAHARRTPLLPAPQQVWQRITHCCPVSLGYRKSSVLRIPGGLHDSWSLPVFVSSVETPHSLRVGLAQRF